MEHEIQTPPLTLHDFYKKIVSTIKTVTLTNLPILI